MVRAVLLSFFPPFRRNGGVFGSRSLDGSTDERDGGKHCDAEWRARANRRAHRHRLGILSMIFCFALGIANIFTFNVFIIIFSVLCLYVPPLAPNTTAPSPFFNFLAQKHTNCPPNPAGSVSSFIILFIEVPLLLRICPTSSTFNSAIRRISTNYMRAATYAIMAIVQWLSIIARATSLIAAAVLLTFTAVCYLLAGIKGQAFVGSKTLGGSGVAQMIV